MEYYPFDSKKQLYKSIFGAVASEEKLTLRLLLHKDAHVHEAFLILKDDTETQDKQIKLDNPEVATKTYQKVMEMRELTEAERTNVNKFKLVLKKLFDVYFKGQKFRRNLCVFWAIILGFDIATENYFGALMMAAAITLYTSPIKFIKQVKKIFGKKKREELSEELSKMNVLGYVNSVPEDEGVQLYFKPKAPNM